MTDIYEKITKQIKNHDHFIILAHKSIDLDAFGSALCMYQIISSYQKKVAILMSDKQKNISVQKSMHLLKEKGIEIQYITKDQINYNNQSTLAIILDTNKQELLEYPSILDQIPNCILLDHHIESEDTITNVTLKYIDNNVSSTAEIVTGYLKFTNKTISKEVATILLAGLTVDTNNFNIKTTSKTYETAAYLMTLGADNIEKQQLLKENKENYVARQDFVKNSNMINDSMALCIMDNQIHQNHELALIAEDLLQFDAVEASFAIGFIGKRLVGISARSVGTIDVETYMRALGGGGHKTDAACTIKASNLYKVKKMLLKLIQEKR